MKWQGHLLTALAVLGTLLLFVYAAGVLTAEPCLGVADIFDFARVAEPAGIEHESPLEAPGYYVRCQFRTKAASFGSAPSSAAALAVAAKGLTFLGRAPAGHLALRQMGLLCLALAAGILLAGLAAGLRPALALLLTYVLVDPGYLLFFNSFYADGALFLALFGTVIFCERVGHLPQALLDDRRAWAAALSALAFLMLLGGGSKMLFVLLPAITLLALAPRLPWRRAPRRALTLVLMLLGIEALVFWNFFFGPGPRFLEFNNFHAVYGGILRVSSDPEAVFDRLAIPPEYRGIAREDAWTANVFLDHPVHLPLRQLSRARLLLFYLEDPPALGATLGEISEKLSLIASHPRGTYPRPETDTHPVKRIYGESWQFSNLTRMVYAQWAGAIPLLLALALGRLVVAACRRRWTGACAAILFLLLWFFSQCALAVLGEGFINLHQHLVGARLALDFLLVLLLADLVGSTSAALPLRKPVCGRSP